MPDDEQPPERIWHDDEALKEWWEGVELARKERTKPAGDRVQEVPMDDNELTAKWRR